jgi:cytochrome oxidase Cu insertion factor (SCO1/SenC/PrrC family)
MYFLRATASMRSRVALTIVLIAGAATLMGCRRQTQDLGERGGFAMRDASDCLPDITLVDQHGHNVSLASLKGKPCCSISFTLPVPDRACCSRRA